MNNFHWKTVSKHLPFIRKSDRGLFNVTLTSSKSGILVEFQDFCGTFQVSIPLHQSTSSAHANIEKLIEDLDKQENSIESWRNYITLKYPKAQGGTF